MKFSFIIPTKNNNKLVKNCLEGILKHEDSSQYHMYVADTGSTKRNLDDLVAFCRPFYKNITIISYSYYNFAKINNNVIKNHIDKDTEYVVFCNDDIELKCSILDKIKDNKKIATQGFLLRFPDGTIQHAGQFFKLEIDNLLLGHLHYKQYLKDGLKSEYVQGNTFALSVVPLSIYNEVGGLNESYKNCFEDVEFNLKSTLLGYKHYLHTNVSIIHHESISRDKNSNKNEVMMNDYYNTLMPFINKNTQELKNLL